MSAGAVTTPDAPAHRHGQDVPAGVARSERLRKRSLARYVSPTTHSYFSNRARKHASPQTVPKAGFPAKSGLSA